MTADGTCREMIYPRDRTDWSSGSRPCGKRAKEDGLCGFHLSVRRKAQERADASRAKREADERLKAGAARRADKLREFGAPGTPRAHYAPSFDRGLGSYTGGVVLTAEQADWVLARLAELPRTSG